MSRILRAAVYLGLIGLTGCSGGGNSPPRNLDNACSIFDQRPTYQRALKKTERRWDVPIPVLMATIYQESKFDGNARTPHKYLLGVIPMGRQSSAYGYSQALDATWKEYKRETGHWRARRDRIKDASDFMGWYMNRTHARNGVALSDARNQYLAYHEGQSGFSRGSYKHKAWLLNIADSVAARAETYRVQIRRCR